MLYAKEHMSILYVDRKKFEKLSFFFFFLFVFGILIFSTQMSVRY
jgi:hypothetical protein